MSFNQSVVDAINRSGYNRIALAIASVPPGDTTVQLMDCTDKLLEEIDPKRIVDIQIHTNSAGVFVYIFYTVLVGLGENNAK